MRVRQAERADAPFLTRMLTEAVTAVTPHNPDHVADDSQIRGYITGWPRPSDRGFIAIDAQDQPIGACWLRYRTAADPGYGHLADDIPEMTIALQPDIRGRGIGRMLLNHTITDARTRGITALSLNVEHNNHAARNLYRSLGWQTVRTDGTSDTMRLELIPDPEHQHQTAHPIG